MVKGFSARTRWSILMLQFCCQWLYRWWAQPVLLSLVTSFSVPPVFLFDSHAFCVCMWRGGGGSEGGGRLRWKQMGVVGGGGGVMDRTLLLFFLDWHQLIELRLSLDKTDSGPWFLSLLCLSVSNLFSCYLAHSIPLTSPPHPAPTPPTPLPPILCSLFLKPCIFTCICRVHLMTWRCRVVNAVAI